MSLLQRVLRRLRNAWLALRDPNVGLALPGQVIDPLRPLEDLVREARALGRSHADQFDQWDFGGPDDGTDDVMDPPEVQSLRRSARAAVSQYRQDQLNVSARLGNLPERIRELDQFLANAKRNIARVAASKVDAERQALNLVAVRLEARAEANADWPEEWERRKATAGQNEDAEQVNAWQRRLRDRAEKRAKRTYIEEQVQLAELNWRISQPPIPDGAEELWEGPNPPLNVWWRTAMLAFFTVIAFPLATIVARGYANGSTARLWAGFVASGVVGVPYALGALFRAREATGFDRMLRALILTLVVVVLGLVGGAGALAAAIVQDEAAFGTTAGGLSQFTPVTVRVVVIVLALLPSLMAFMLGMARRHPFHDAYVRQRRQRDRLLNRATQLGGLINAGYLGPGRENIGTDQERAIIEAYMAAEEAYLSGLAEAIADPTFTEAVQRRRGRRLVAGPLAVETPPEPEPQP